MSQIINKKIINKKGFTLIELLVVISIIGLLSTVILASLQNVRRDAKWRKFESELIQIKTAVQLYRENHNGNWPPSMNTDYNSVEILVTELKNAGVYPSSKISYPESDLDENYVFLIRGFKVDINSQWACGSTNYRDTYYLIVLYSNNDMYKPFRTKLPFVYDGTYMYDNVGEGYQYCIDFK